MSGSDTRDQRALAYLRVSGRGQAADGKDGFDRQRISIQRYADANGITIAEDSWFTDIQSGKDEWQDRPGWSAMMLALNGTRTVLVEKLDRVAREVLVQELIMRDLRKREVTLMSSTGDDTSDENLERKMLRQILAVFAEYERGATVLKLRGARQRKKDETGRCEGRKPYGMRAGEAAVIDMMRRMRALEVSYDRIAAQLNTAGHLTRMGRQWIGPTIRRILDRYERSPPIYG